MQQQLQHYAGGMQQAACACDGTCLSVADGKQAVLMH
jgi:hypothetical protein